MAYNGVLYVLNVVYYVGVGRRLVPLGLMHLVNFWVMVWIGVQNNMQNWASPKMWNMSPVEEPYKQLLPGTVG